MIIGAADYTATEIQGVKRTHNDRENVESEIKYVKRDQGLKYQLRYFWERERERERESKKP